MKTTLAAIGVLTALAAAVGQGGKQQIGPVVAEGFSEFTLTKNEAILTGPRVYVRTTDGRFEAKAQKIVIRFGPGGPRAGVGALQGASLSGEVWLRSEPEPGRWTAASAQRADVDWAESRQAVLTGSVHVESRDPSMFSNTATVDADKAIVSLKSDKELRPGETRIRIESEPSRSRLKFTPLPPMKSGEQGESAH